MTNNWQKVFGNGLFIAIGAVIGMLILLYVAFTVNYDERDVDGKRNRSTGLEYAPQMYHTIPLEPYEQLDYVKYNPKGQTVRHAPDNTVPVDQAYPALPYEKPEVLRNNPELFTQRQEESDELQIPDWVPPTQATIDEGQRLYEIFCDHCHGAKGKGDGPISKEEKIIVPSYETRMDLSDGRIYYSITYGLNAMGPHAHLVTPTERWHLVRYVKYLQGRSEVQGDAATDAAADEADDADDADDAQEDMGDMEAETADATTTE